LKTVGLCTSRRRKQTVTVAQIIERWWQTKRGPCLYSNLYHFLSIRLSLKYCTFRGVGLKVRKKEFNRKEVYKEATMQFHQPTNHQPSIYEQGWATWPDSLLVFIVFTCFRRFCLVVLAWIMWWIQLDLLPAISNSKSHIPRSPLCS